MSNTYYDYQGDGYYVTVQYCEHPGCEEYLGVNYPSDFCTEHRQVFTQEEAECRDS